MSSRLGPVFDTEMKISSRRWQVYAGRALFVVCLLIGMTSIWWSYLDAQWSVGLQNQAKIGEAYFYAMVGVQLALTMIVAPAATAGAVCVERSRGSLAHMLVTDLTSREIILGKLVARLLPTFALIACAWPVAALGTLLGGINPDDLTMAFAITLAVGILGCSLALAFSTWAKTVHEVLMAVYTFWGMILLAYPIGYSLSFTFGGWFAKRWMLTANPFWLAFAPYIEPGKNGLWEYGCFFGVALGLSALSLVVSILGVRVNPLGEARPRRKSRVTRGLSLVGRITRRLPGPSLDGNPVLWREWNRTRSSRPMRIVMTALLLASTIACCHGAWEILTEGFHPRVGIAGVMAMLIQTVFGLLVIAVFASLAFSEERRRGSLDVLLSTPLSTRSIVRGKWFATFRILPLLAIGPALLCGAFALDDLSQYTATLPAAARTQPLNGSDRAFAAFLMPLTILAHGAWMASLGLALSVWIRRESRAIAVVATVYVLYAIGMPVAAIVLAGPSGNGPFSAIAPILASSPVFAAIQIIESLTNRWVDTRGVLQWIAFWDLAAMGGALFLLRATTRVFDRKFDRVSEDWLLNPPRERPKSRQGVPIPEHLGDSPGKPEGKFQFQE
ncbi:ABC transporter permease [Tundrisphaera lichenicola]|uniref:ABC transporter permease n=1 Tax=Tundrisphaera lichenicola TaxID=2029860 RepID=UPI003EBA3489